MSFDRKIFIWLSAAPTSRLLAFPQPCNLRRKKRENPGNPGGNCYKSLRVIKLIAARLVAEFMNHGGFSIIHCKDGAS
jgi:hypothetical protein